MTIHNERMSTPPPYEEFVLRTIRVINPFPTTRLPHGGKNPIHFLNSGIHVCHACLSEKTPVRYQWNPHDRADILHIFNYAKIKYIFACVFGSRKEIKLLCLLEL